MNKQEHNKEIIASRKGGFGGSDAAMFLRIAERGVDNLSNTDLKRIAVAMGLREPAPSYTNAAMEAGHSFEDWVEQNAVNHNDNFVREAYLCREIVPTFKTFAHADFHVEQTGLVVECKYSQLTTQEVEDTYAAQLQWYYMLGAENVLLYHGWGGVEPFKVDGKHEIFIVKDNTMIDKLLDGIVALNDAILNGWKPVPADEMLEADVPTEVQSALKELRTIKMQQEELAKREQEAKAIVADYMLLTDTANIRGEGFVATYTQKTTRKSFDAKAFLKENPQFDQEKWWKTSEAAGSLRIKY